MRAVKCKYCGKSAGLFSSKHTECENLHQQGIVDLRSCLKKYFSGQIDISSVRSTMMNVRRMNFIDKHDAIIVFPLPGLPVRIRL